MDIFTFNNIDTGIFTKTGIFTIGRMNPPHPGHMFIIETMINKAIDQDINEIFVIITATINIDKNPLICIDKKKLLVDYIIPKIKENMIEKFPKKKDNIYKLKVNVFCTENPDILEPNLNNSVPISFNSIVRNNNLSKIFLIVGKDREDSFKTLFEKNKNVVVIPISRDNPNEKSANISGTMIRTFVLNNDSKKFNVIMKPTGIPDNILTKMFDVIKHNLTEIKKKDEKKPLFYNYVFEKSNNSHENINKNGKRIRSKSSEENSGGKKKLTRKKRNKVFKPKRISCKTRK
jgi:nicotinic acid mononucleotide adenylyltransferase